MKIIFYILLLVGCDCYAQDDYVILQSNDTLYGKVVRGNLERNRLTIKNKEGKKKIHLREIKEWRSGKMPVTVISGKRKKRTYWMELLLVVDGKKKLYKDYYFEWANSYYILNANTYTPITKNNLYHTLISELMLCKQFSAKYSSTKIKISKIEGVLAYYNNICEIEPDR